MLSKTLLVNNDEDFEKLIQHAKETLPENGGIPEISHSIKLKQEKPIYKKEYIVPYKLRKQVKLELDSLEKRRIIRRSTSSFAMPAFPIGKKNGEIRLVVDYRPLNKLTVPEPFPFPNLHEMLSNLKDSTIFSQIDLRTGYYQIRIADKDIHKTSFVILGRQYEFLRMPFGLSNAPRTFQRAMVNLLGHLEFVKIFLDDILIHSRNKEEHLLHLKEIFKIFKNNKIAINWQKSKFNKRSVTYLGMQISQSGIKADNTTIQKLKHINMHPKSVKELRQILGLLNWFRPYVVNLSTMLSTLTEKLKKDTKFTWKEKDQHDLKKIVSKIEENIELAHPDFTQEFQMYTDASDIGISAVLCQKEQIIGIYSHKLLNSEKNYSIVEKECFAIIKGLHHFRTIIYNSELLIYTDNLNITHIKDYASSRWQRWKIILEEYNYKLMHIS